MDEIFNSIVITYFGGNSQTVGGFSLSDVFKQIERMASLYPDKAPKLSDIKSIACNRNNR